MPSQAHSAPSQTEIVEQLVQLIHRSPELRKGSRKLAYLAGAIQALGWVSGAGWRPPLEASDL